MTPDEERNEMLRRIDESIRDVDASLSWLFLVLLIIAAVQSCKH